MNLKALNAAIADRYTPDRCVELANEGHPLLASLPRMTTFGGTNLVITRPGKPQVILTRGRDYERVRCGADDAHDLMRRCDDALRKLGDRMESNLKGMGRESLDFQEEADHAGLFSMRSFSRDQINQQWEADKLTLYSLGSAPRLLDDPAECVLVKNSDEVEVRFGYYAQVGPS